MPGSYLGHVTASEVSRVFPHFLHVITLQVTKDHDWLLPYHFQFIIHEPCHTVPAASSARPCTSRVTLSILTPAPKSSFMHKLAVVFLTNQSQKNITAFCNATPNCLTDRYRRFWRTWYLHLDGRKVKHFQPGRRSQRSPSRYCLPNYAASQNARLF